MVENLLAILILGALLLLIGIFIRIASVVRRVVDETRQDTSEALKNIADHERRAKTRSQSLLQNQRSLESAIEAQRSETSRSLLEIRQLVVKTLRDENRGDERQGKVPSPLSTEEVEHFFKDIYTTAEALGAGKFIPIEQLATEYVNRTEVDQARFDELLRAARLQYADQIEVEKSNDGRALIRLTG